MGRQGRPSGPSHPGEVTRDETIDNLRRRLREAKAQVTDVQGKFDALATVAANLYQENIALKKKPTSVAKPRLSEPQTMAIWWPQVKWPGGRTWMRMAIATPPPRPSPTQL